MNNKPLSEIQDQSTAILNSISDTVFLTDESGDFTFICQNKDAIFGYSIEEIEKFENIFNLIPGLDKSIVATKKEITDIELEISTKQREIKNLLCNIKPVEIEKGRLLFTFRDITKRKRVEEALKSSEENLRLISENVRDVLYLYDPHVDKFIYISPSFEKIWQQSVQDVYDEPTAFSKSVHPDDQPAFFEAVRKEHEEGQYFNLEYRIVRADGKTRWIWSRNFPADVNQKDHPLTVGIAEDITDWKQSEIELRLSQEFNQALINNSPIGISVRSKTGQLISANDAWKQIWAIPDEEIEKDISLERESLTFNQRDSYLKDHQVEVRRVYEQGGHLILPRLKITSPRPGAAAWVSQHFYAINDEHGGVDRVVILTEDITESVQAEDALRESEQKYRDVSELVSNYAYSFLVKENGDLELEWITDAFTKITGFSPEESERRGGWVQLSHPDDLTIAQGRSETLLKGKSDVSEFRIITKNGEIRWIQDHGIPEYSDEEARVVKILGAAKDVTKRKFAEQNLKFHHKFLDSILENSQMGVFVVDVIDEQKYKYAYVNPTHELISGVKSEQVVGKSPEALREFYDDEAVQIVYNLYDASVKSKKTIELEHPVTVDGEEIWWFSRITPLTDNQGQVYQLIGNAIIITELKNTQLDLENKSILLEEAQKVGQFGSWDWNIKTGEAFWSQGLFDIYGRDPDENFPPLENDQWLETIFPDDRDVLQAAIQAAIDQDGVYDTEYRIIRENDGQIRNIRARGKIISDKNGEPEKLLGTTQDITDWREAEKKLFEANYLLNSWMENYPSVTFVKDLSGRITYVNRAFEALFDLSPGEIIGKTDYDLYSSSPDTAKQMQANDLMVIESNMPHNIEETVMVDGKPQHFESSKFPLRDVDGNVIGVAGVATNITERKNAEMALQDSQVQLQAIFDNSLNAILVADDAGNYNTANQAAAEMFGYEIEKILSMNVGDLRTTREPDAAVRYDDYIKKGFEIGEFNFLRSDGQSRIAQYHAVRVRENFNLSVLTDITQRKQSEKEHQKLHAQIIKDANELEKRVQERTEQYQTIINLTADREIRMAELKKVIKKLRRQIIEAGMEPMADDPLDLDLDA